MIDLSSVNYVLPLVSFVFAFVLFFAILFKTEILGDNVAIMAIISFVISVIFISLTNVRAFVEEILPWFTVVVVLLFFAVLITAFIIKKPEEVLKPGLAWGFLALMAVIVIFVWYSHFDIATNHSFIHIKRWFLRNSGTVWLAIVAVIVSIFLVKAK